MFTGGDQTKLAQMILDTKIHKTLQKKYKEENFVIAGTSAGAMAMSETMIEGGGSAESLLRGQVSINRGLGFAHHLIIDSHFVKRGRFGRLIQSVAENPELLGVGLGEDTGVLITEGSKFEVIGAGVPLGDPISIENMIVHVLSKGDKYDLDIRKMLPRN
jgi:cyanophycinase